MKLKGINPFEQHVEKIVVGGIAVVGLGVLSAQFLGSSNQIKVGNEEVSPERAYDPVKKEAEKLLGRVRSTTPTLPEAPKVDVLEKFETAVAGGIAPAPKLAGNFAVRANIGNTKLDTLGGDRVVADVTIPAPGVPVARISTGTIDPVEWATVPGLKAFLPPEQPFDKFSVSVEVSFDGKAFKDALTSDPDGSDGPIQPIPLGWVNNNVEIVAVEVEREQLDASGGTPAPTMLRPIPGRPDLLDVITKTVKAPGDMPRVLEDARLSREGVLRPAFYSYIAGEPWSPPTELQESGGANEKLVKAQKKLADVSAELEKLRKALDKQKNPVDRPGPGGPGGGGGGGGGKGAGGGGGGQPPPRREAPQPDNKKPVKSGLERKIEAKELEETSLTRQVEALKLEMDGKKVGKVGQPQTAVMDDPKVRLWAHDLQAEPGATYRYHVRVVANNPLYGRESSLIESQKERARQPLIRGEWSEWSEPITVDQKTYYFVTSANERDNLGPARASVDLMQFYYGYYRKAVLGSVNPGDVFVGEAKLPPELVIYDLKKIAEGARPKSEGGIAAGPEGEGESGRGSRPGGGKGRGEVREVAVSEQAQPTPPKDDLAKPGPEKLTMSMDAMLLDVASGPAPSAASIGKVATMRAFIRERSGQIVVKSPEQQRDDPVFQRVDRSAKLGEAQSKPKAAEKKPNGEGPRTRENDPTPPPPPGGGGGGGG